jgi:hypothetical protein
MGGCAGVERGPHQNPITRSAFLRPDFDISPKIDDKKNLESYYLFWLDSTVKSPEHIETAIELRSIINYLKTFETNMECQREFNKIINGKIFLIASYSQGLSLLPTIHDHKQLHSVYIYQKNDTVDMERITDQYKKVFYIRFDRF